MISRTETEVHPTMLDALTRAEDLRYGVCSYSWPEGPGREITDLMDELSRLGEADGCVSHSYLLTRPVGRGQSGIAYLHHTSGSETQPVMTIVTSRAWPEELEIDDFEDPYETSRSPGSIYRDRTRG